MFAWLVQLPLATGCKGKEPAAGQTAGSAPAPGDAAGPKTLADQLEAFRTKLGLPAIAAAAWHDGKLVENVAVGLRKVDDAASKVTTQDKWHLGSNTKAMTAALLAIYVDRGTLRWTDTLGQIFAGDKIDPGYKAVTLDQLVRHEGGAPGATTVPDDLWKQLWTDGTAPDARSKFVKAILARPPTQAPGTFEYSNTGYVLAAAMLEHKTTKRWEDLIRDELFAKLDMKSCGFGAPGSKAGASPGFAGARSDAEGRREVSIDQPWGHDAGGTPIAPGPAADNPPGIGPAGTVHCSLEDYGKFLNVFATGTTLISPEAMQHLQTPRDKNGYAGGWSVMSNGAKALMVHSGSNTMWYATAVVAPAKKVAFVVVTNKGEEKLEETLEQLMIRWLQ